MNRTSDTGVRPSTSDWGLMLPCGHEIGVPWNSPVPVMVSCAVRHRRDCRGGADEMILTGLGGAEDRSLGGSRP
jgi:hypothetical protein